MVNRYLWRYTPILIVVVASLLTVIYTLAAKSETNQETIFRIGHGFFMTAGLWLGCIGIVSYLWKRFPWQEKPIPHLLLEILLITVYTISYSWLIYSLGKLLTGRSYEINMVYDIFLTLLITYFITAVHEAVFFYRQWKHNFSRSVKLERDNIKANYDALKNQVNPHFLFNSLNSLSAMVEDNIEAVRYVGNLSNFLRYLLRSNEKELVKLEEEAEIVKQYLDVQMSRFGEALQVDWDIEKAALQGLMPPLALQMLTENSIKHNIVSLDQKLLIKIFSDGPDCLIVENNLNPKKSPISTGNGLRNIEERYKMFTARNIEITNNGFVFQVKVPLLKLEL